MSFFTIDPSIIPYALPPFISSLILLILGLFVYLKNKHSATNFYLFAFMFMCAIWQASFAGMNLMKFQDGAFFFVRLVYTGVCFIPIAFYGFAINLAEISRSRKIIFGLILGLSLYFLFILWSSRKLIAGNIHYSWGFSGKVGPTHTIFIIFFAAVFSISFLELYKAYRKSKLENTEKSNRIKYVLIASLISVIAATDFLSAYGIDYYPLGFVFMLAFSGSTAYAIIKHKLLDINLVLKKGFLFSISLTIVSIILVLLVITAEKLSRIYFGYSSILFTLIAAALYTVLFIPIHNFFIYQLNRLIFSGSTEELSERSEKLMHEIQGQDRMKAVATLAAGMAHEIKNPLTAIKTFTEHLPEKSKDPQFIQKFTAVVSSEVEKINSIVKQLLEFSKPATPILQKLDVTTVLDETLDLLNAELSKYQIIVEKNYQSPAPPINGDKKQLKQIFLNLFLNSIEAMPHGGQLTISVAPDNRDTLTITISDTGVGIPKEQLSHIFDPFFTTKESGTGLGLSIVYGIVREHDGKIKIENNQNNGCLVKIGFPLPP